MFPFFKLIYHQKNAQKRETQIPQGTHIASRSVSSRPLYVCRRKRLGVNGSTAGSAVAPKWRCRGRAQGAAAMGLGSAAQLRGLRSLRVLCMHIVHACNIVHAYYACICMHIMHACICTCMHSPDGHFSLTPYVRKGRLFEVL